MGEHQKGANRLSDCKGWFDHTVHHIIFLSDGMWRDGFSQQDLEMIRPVVYSNCIHSMLSILRAMFHLQIEYADNERVA
ncbi:unnamed protein product [Strongylus vulgaris]|uniref:Uncharacterized protein n=1 Tax=Strongylus vulgaris TaxID=40348 RepID=A0A3P7JAI4_STRVU|nr:unnamed protein product [Strongylus vulgaris]